MKIFIEISKGSNLKYEHNKEYDCLELDRILHNTNAFPYNYGYIPNTLSPDGDPLDIIVLCDYAIIPGTIANVKVIGAVETEDEKGVDDKIVAVLDEKIDPKSKYYNNIDDINKVELDNIIYFLTHYKDNEAGKSVKLGSVLNKNDAEEIIVKYTLG